MGINTYLYNESFVIINDPFMWSVLFHPLVLYPRLGRCRPFLPNCVVYFGKFGKGWVLGNLYFEKFIIFERYNLIGIPFLRYTVSNVYCLITLALDYIWCKGNYWNLDKNIGKWRHTLKCRKSSVYPLCHKIKNHSIISKANIHCLNKLT